MKTKFINFEGIHGCGKSTTAWLLNQKLCQEGIKSKVFLEVHMDNVQKSPCDIRFFSVLDEKDYRELITKEVKHSDLIKRISERIDQYYLIYSPDIKDDNVELVEKLKYYNAYDGRLDSETFIRIMLQRYRNFVDKALNDDVVYIFESVLFQYIINELLRFSDLSEEKICECIFELTNILKPLNPVLFHLRTNNLRSTIDIIAAERLSDNYDLYPDWIDWMVEYVKNSKYGEVNNVQDREDLMVYFYKRANIEEQVFDLLDIEKYSIDINSISRETLNEIVYKKVIS